ncbi:hypothetical protein Ocin01_14166 [Orchesella cincta]|uniref:Uncharacterized protein n=1 Tax=Orchesella cincta TaxID=48709 RepID=A0A1D2MHQ2_ORCCI|nr:hypothetical protein Ocin01_14166 [Orchesella cincta]
MILAIRFPAIAEEVRKSELKFGKIQPQNLDIDTFHQYTDYAPGWQCIVPESHREIPHTAIWGSIYDLLVD